MSASDSGTIPGPHIGDLAELHALGALEPGESAQVEAHIAVCAQCARALGAAEATVAALQDAFVEHVELPDRLGARIAASACAATFVAPSRFAGRGRWPVSTLVAAAAALVLGIGGGALLERAADMQTAARESAVLATIATSHFNHVTLTARATAAPVSKVLYARDGAWFYVVIDSAACACRVIAQSASGRRDLGQPISRGSTSTLFVHDGSRPTSIALSDASGAIISGATIVYASR